MSNLLTTHRDFRAALLDHDVDKGRKHWKDYREARDVAQRAQRGAYAAWWFIENVAQDDPARNDIFFELREIMRNAL